MKAKTAFSSGLDRCDTCTLEIERERAQNKQQARTDPFRALLIGATETMCGLYRMMEQAAAVPISILLEGETGTGKELVARGIHQASARATAPFMPVNCAALPETLLESALFGHRRGAFTGADRDHKGFFEAAEGGTIFLDEVGDMPLVMQAKLLRVLQDGEITPLGETQPHHVDTRVIAASNRNLATAFRPDLYYRLAVLQIRLPALRERRHDIPDLARHFVRQATFRWHRTVDGIEDDALECLQLYGWPGNVRELRNEMERCVALSGERAAITTDRLSDRLQEART